MGNLRAQLRQLSWLEDVDNEARQMRSARKAHGHAAAGGSQQLAVWEVLPDHEWFNENPTPLPNEVSQLLGHFLHDQMVQSAAQRSAKSLSGQHYFDIRGFDMNTTA